MQRTDFIVDMAAAGSYISGHTFRLSSFPLRPAPASRRSPMYRIRILSLLAASLAILLILAATTTRAETPGVVLHGKTGPAAGKHVVLIAADDEYRSEELIPQLAKILAMHHGCNQHRSEEHTSELQS